MAASEQEVRDAWEKFVAVAGRKPLVGVQDAADLLPVSHKTYIGKLRQRGVLTPIVILPSGPIFLRVEVVAIGREMRAAQRKRRR
jgi:hypothetical protein